jgi:hypothetical protein
MPAAVIAAPSTKHKQALRPPPSARSRWIQQGTGNRSTRQRPKVRLYAEDETHRRVEVCPPPRGARAQWIARLPPDRGQIGDQNRASPSQDRPRLLAPDRRARPVTALLSTTGGSHDRDVRSMANGYRCRTTSATRSSRSGATALWSKQSCCSERRCTRCGRLLCRRGDRDPAGVSEANAIVRELLMEPASEKSGGQCGEATDQPDARAASAMRSS